MIIKLVKGIWKHPKKSIAFAGILTFAGNFAKRKYEENCLMRAYCLEAQNYGNMPYNADDERHVTVILNPAANDGKGKNKYEKYCAPLLHLAGMKVALVRTEREDEAKQLMDVMDNTSAVIIAGGDGTLSEILTGLLRREDCKTAVKRFPLGILPLGATNTAASSLFGFNTTPEVEHLAEATMAIVRNMKRHMDVMEITPIEFSETGEVTLSKPVFAASTLEWGAYRDTHERKSVYWYWAYLKKYMVYIFSTYKDLTWDCAADIEFSLPCSGCSKCKTNEEVEPISPVQRPKRWWEAFLPRTKNSDLDADAEKIIDYSQIINEKCGLKQQINIENISDLRISTCNSTDSEHIPGHSIILKLGQEKLSSLEFIKEGWNREWNCVRTYDKEFSIGELDLIPKDKTLKDKQGNDRKFYIDNDDYEVRPMKIKPRPKAVTVFAQPSATKLTM